MVKPEIRRAIPQDFDRIYEFINELEACVFDEDRQRKIFLRNIDDPDKLYLVATVAGEIAGYLSCHIQYLLHHGGTVGEIQEMFISPANRRKGLGEMLITELKTFAANRQVVQLEVTAHRNRTAAQSFYETQLFNFTHKKFVFPIDG